MKYFLLSVFLISSLIVNSQESRLSIFSENGDAFMVLNGIRQNETPSSNIVVDYLINEYYDTKIIFENKNIKNIEKNLMLADVDGFRGEFTYKIKETKRGKKLRLFSFTPFEAISAPPSHVQIVHYNSKPLGPIVQTTSTTTTQSNGDSINIGVGINTNNNGTNVGVGININSGISSTTTTTTQTIPNNQTVIEEPICYAMSETDFALALSSIENQNFADSRLTLAKQIAKGNCLTAQQIAKIITKFTFENNKLSFAKYAYTLCYNPENYWKINDSFGFSSSIDELNEYIESLQF